MFEFAFGDITVTRVVEMEMPMLHAATFFPDWDDALIQLHLDWLVPRHFDPASGNVVISIQAFLIRTPRHTILVDSCVGNHKPRNRKMFNDAVFPWMDNFRATGVVPEEIDFVLCTHMHVDHVGWNTKLEDGRWVPTFPNAKYIFARAELEYWLEQSEQNRMLRTGDYIEDSVTPILEAKQEIIVDMDHQIDEGLTLLPLPGHTPGMVGLNVQSAGDRAVLCGDMMHHMIQCHIPDWSTIACADMAAAHDTRWAFLENYADTQVTILPSHFPNPTAGFVIPNKDTFAFRYVSE
ncbi:MAG: MBL fold metallo-hydrolase [Pseudomonadota bacterium]|nr:MBL fold metallo-hydrolase [Pseudomonadota bacterium]